MIIGGSTEKQETLSSTIDLFSKRTAALQSILNSLPQLKCVIDVQQKLNTIKERITARKVGVSGGTFEWVDSVLVKVVLTYQSVLLVLLYGIYNNAWVYSSYQLASSVAGHVLHM